MSDLFGIDAGTYGLWQAAKPEPLTRERLYAALAQLADRQRLAALRPFNPILPKSLADQLAAMEKAKWAK